MNMFNDMFLDMVPNNNVNDTSLFNPYEAYMKGNLFKNLYDEYKDYKSARLVPNNEQAELLLNLSQICFENQDIKLYLDIYPTDRGMITKYNKNVGIINNLTREYEEKYGPISSDYMSNNESFSWEETVFPWEEVNR